MNDPVSKQHMLEIAANYDALAERATLEDPNFQPVDNSGMDRTKQGFTAGPDPHVEHRTGGGVVDQRKGAPGVGRA